MKLLRFNWQAYDPIGGMKYVTGVVIIIALSKVFPDFPWFATGLSAALAWLTTTIPGRRADRLLGALIFIERRQTRTRERTCNPMQLRSFC